MREAFARPAAWPTRVRESGEVRAPACASPGRRGRGNLPFQAKGRGKREFGTARPAVASRIESGGSPTRSPIEIDDGRAPRRHPPRITHRSGQEPMAILEGGSPPVTGGERNSREMMAPPRPIGRIGTPDGVADLVAWRLSDKASFVSGASIPVDGGFTAQQSGRTGRPSSPVRRGVSTAPQSRPAQPHAVAEGPPRRGDANMRRGGRRLLPPLGDIERPRLQGAATARPAELASETLVEGRDVRAVRVGDLFRPNASRTRSPIRRWSTAWLDAFPSGRTWSAR